MSRESSISPPGHLTTVSLSSQALEAGLRAVTLDGVFSQAMAAFTTGVILLGYAVELGASDFVVGLLASIPFLAQFAQLPAIWLVERSGQRRRIVVAAAATARLFLVPLALLPLAPASLHIPGLLVASVVSALGNAVASCAWNSWMRDLVPEDRLGAFFSRRLFLATASGMIAGLLAGAMIARWKSAHPETAMLVYGGLFLLGLAAGLASLWLLMRTPEPPAPRSASGDVLRLLAAPFRDRDFRALVVFLTSWNFAANLVAPFFAIYMLRWLGYDMGFVTMVTVLSQLANLTVTQMWGRFADLYGNRSVLALTVPLFVMSLFLWTFTTAPERHAMTTPLVIVLHLALGIATAGTTLASSNIALKLAPRGAATTYLAANALATSLAAGAATILGGCLANLFATTELSLVLHWGSRGHAVDIAAVDFRRLDFLFLIAFACGLYAVHRLTHVVEPGAAEDQHLRGEILMATRQTVMRTLSSVAGLRGVTALPFTPRPWRGEAGD